MEPFQKLIQRLREERGLTQFQLGVQAGVSPDTIGKAEQETGRKWHRSTAMRVYHVLSAVLPLSEAEAHAYLTQCGLSPGLHGAPGRLPDDEYMREVVAGRVAYAGSDRAQRPPLPTEAITFAGYAVGASSPQAVELTPTLLQHVCDLVATIGIVRAEETVKDLLMSKPPGTLGGIAPPQGSVAVSHDHGVTEFIPINPPAPNVADPSKPKAKKLR